MENEIVKYMDFLYNCAKKWTKDHHFSEDLVQETVLKAIKNKNLFQHNTDVKSWLYVILYNNFVNQYRKNKIRNYMPIYDIFDETFFKNNTYINPTQIPSLQIKDAFKCLSGMSQIKQDIFNLYFFEGLTYEEIAKIKNIPIGTVKSNISRIHKELREKTG
jgi:RNA polymerase sigma-70 factor (ECF subfamily)